MRSTMDFSVKSNVKEMINKLRDAQQRIVPSATVYALNRAAEQTRTAIIKESTADLNVKYGVLKTRIRFQPF